MLRPSITLIFDLDERIADKETKLEIKRNYSYICQPSIWTHESAAPDKDGQEAPIHNILHFAVKMGTYKYLFSEDEGADELWNDVVEPWIRNILYKVGNNMRAFNTRQWKIKRDCLYFDRADIELQGGIFTVGLHPNAVSWLDPKLHTSVGLARKLLNDGTIKGAVRVDIPSESSYELQRHKKWAEWVDKHPEPQEIEVSEKVETPQQPQKSEAQLLEEDRIAKSYENTHVAPTNSDALPPIKHEPEPEEPEQFDFEIDYHVWDITYEDGSTKTLDTQAMTFIA